ncbi:sensor histidine kinase [Aminipila sp.]|uniref:sensor histidine kinase n=1 Tax=Aminipila sp. TaxID=2060095 RepID=UPI0028A23A7A|nr:HAMP domain-containing sensor histidine kinase [Aminipila sp.]
MIVFLWASIAILSGIVCFLIMKQYIQYRQIKNIKITIEDILGGQDSSTLFTNKDDVLGELVFEINKLISSYRVQKQNYEKERNSKKELLSNLSHDVRTPLVSVIGYIEAVIQNRIDERNKNDYIETAYNKALVLKEQINQLFELVQSDANEIVLHFEKVDICELLRQVIIDFLPAIEKDQITFESNIPDNEIYISADKYCLTRIYQNLIRNTLIHGKSGNYLGVFVSKTNSDVYVDITDKGMGIEKEHLPFIFDRLYKADNARTRGSGLGLAVSKELANKMNGKIEVLRSIPRDTVFRITFPVIE